MITYEIARSFDVEKIIEVFESSGIVFWNINFYQI